MLNCNDVFESLIHSIDVNVAKSADSKSRIVHLYKRWRFFSQHFFSFTYLKCIAKNIMYSLAIFFWQKTYFSSAMQPFLYLL